MLSNDIFQQRYFQLNPNQKEAVDTIEGPVLVIAGPGSGKTELLSMRVANILRQTDTPASAILCLTFTESAAVNMRERLRKIIGTEANSLAIYTFHGFGTEVINQNSELFFLGHGFRPADELATISILENILSSLPRLDPLNSYHPDHGWSFLGDIKNRIADLKEAGITPESFKEIIDRNQIFLEQAAPLVTDFFAQYPRINTKTVEDWPNLVEAVEAIDYPDCQFNLKRTLVADMRRVLELTRLKEKPDSGPITEWKNQNTESNDRKQRVLKDLVNQKKYYSLANVYALYQIQLHAKELYDFDDMLLEVVKAFQLHPELRYNYQEQYLYILVDEFQDTSGVQTLLIDQLINLEISDNRPNLMVVGDDDQSIYKFQGASLENILQFKQKYQDVKVISLVHNYRSKQIILDLASEIIENSMQRLSRSEAIDKTLISQVK